MIRGRGPKREAGDRPSEQGAVVVEFAIIFVLFMTILWGILSYGMLFAVQQTITHASAEAARASISLDGPDAEARAEAAALNQMSWLGTFIEQGAVTIDAQAAPCPYDITIECLTVIVHYDWGNHAVIPPVLKFGYPVDLAAASTVQLDS